MKSLRFLAVLALSLAILPAAQAQPFPTKPIKIVVPFPPGGAVDSLARMVGTKLTESLGHPTVIDNRPGAGGTIGSEVVAKSPGDGYTLLMGSTSSLSVAPNLQKVPYDPVRDFSPITLVAFVPHVLVINAQTPANNLAEFIAYAKSRPGQLNFASVGNGTPHHIAGEMFKQMAGVNLIHVPYKGTAPALTDLVAGHVTMMSVELASALPFIKAGKLKALGVATPQRVPLAPELPTISEAGVPGFEVTSWYGVVGPAGIPPEVSRLLAATISKAVAAPDMREKLAGMGAFPVGGTPEDFGVFMKKEYAKWAKAIKDSGATVN